MIKYHDNMNGQKYGTDGHLTNNWDACAEFPKDSYIRVYFRIDCLAYDFHMSFDDAESREAFYTEVREILKCFDIVEGTGGRYDGFPMEHLHIHPQNISGVVAKWKVRYIAESLNDCNTCKIRWVDVYQEISTMSNAEFAESLENKRGEIAVDILEMFKTKRRNLYIVPGYGTYDRIVNKYHVSRREAESYNDDTTCTDFVVAVFNELVSGGEIVSTETRNGTGYRAAKKCEKIAVKDGEAIRI